MLFRSHLTSLSEQRLTDEIEGSRDDLQSLLGAEALSFAYPYGDGAESSEIREKLIRTYLLGMTVQDGFNYIETNPYELRRIMILPGDSIKDFERKLRFERSMAVRVRQCLPWAVRTAARRGLGVLGAWNGNSQEGRVCTKPLARPALELSRTVNEPDSHE